MSELADKIVDRLSTRIAHGEFDRAGWRESGIRSRQIYAIVHMLLELGVIEEDLLKKWLERKG